MLHFQRVILEVNMRISFLILPLVLVLSVSALFGQTTATDYYNRGTDRYTQKDYDGAIADYSKAIRLDPQYTDAYRERGLAREVKKNYAGAIIDLTRAIDLDPKNVNSYYNRGHVKMTMGDSHGAMVDYSKVIELDPGHAKAYYFRGVIRGFNLEAADEIADYSKAIELDPKYDAAYLSRGIARRLKGDIEGAIADYTEAIKQNPNSKLAYYNRASERERKRDYDGAIADYTKVIGLDPTGATGYYKRGLVQYYKKEYDEAIVDYTKVLELDPKIAGAYASRGEAKKMIGDFYGAIDDYTKAAETDSSRYLNLGEMKFLTKDYDGAVAEYNKALLVYSEKTNIYIVLGEIKYIKKDYLGAVADFTQAIKVRPNVASLYLKRANAYRAVNKIKRANADVKSAAKLGVTSIPKQNGAMTNIVINQKPLTDFAYDLAKRWEAKEVDLYQNFTLVLNAVLTKDGKFDAAGTKFDPKTQTGDPHVIAVIKEAKEALADSGFLGYLSIVEVDNFIAALIQSNDQMLLVVTSLQKSPERAKIVAEVINTMISVGKVANKNSIDERTLLNGASVNADRNRVILNFSISKTVAQEILIRKLKQVLADKAVRNPS